MEAVAVVAAGEVAAGEVAAGEVAAGEVVEAVAVVEAGEVAAAGAGTPPTMKLARAALPYTSAAVTVMVARPAPTGMTVKMVSVTVTVATAASDDCAV